MRVLVDSNNRSPTDFINFFAVIGAQRTGTNLLREILNTNERIAMLGEVLMPSSALAHWDNFCRNLPVRSAMPATRGEAESLLDRYFNFIEYRIRNHWEGKKKSCIYTFGVDIKYNQLNHIAPADWNSTSSSPFILCYLQSRGVTLIHTTRNVIHSAISTLVALRRHFWHNYDGAVIQHGYYIDVEECLALARTILQQRTLLLNMISGCKVVNCRYESLVNDIKRSGSKLKIPEGPGSLRDIAAALRVPFRFCYDRRLQKAINVPYSRLLANYDAFVRRLRDSEFSKFASTLE